MSNGKNRLERFFKRKGSRPDATTPRNASPVNDITEAQFPSPSFIRPKGSRMAAREEVRRAPPGKSPSVPDLLRLSKATSRPASYDTAELLQIRPTSTHEAFRLALEQYEFPAPPTRDGNARQSTVFSVDSAAYHSSRGRSSIDSGADGYETPPSSDPDDSPRNSTVRKVPYLPRVAPPTSTESPEPSPTGRLRHSQSADVLDKALCRAIMEGFEDTARKLAQTKASRSSFDSESPLREPGLNEFLQLTDDDITESDVPRFVPKAKARPVTPSLPSPTGSWCSSLLELSPPLQSRASTAAAFEAARIAIRYDFDLVCVLNLWPKSSSRPSTSSTQATAVTPLMAKPMAAYNLELSALPLETSSAVYTTILQNHSWVEYQNSQANMEELSRGYARAFHAGEYSNGSGKSTPVSGVRLSERINRGIVFWAYRKCRDPFDRLGPQISSEDLGALHDDAEALVEMVLDIDAAGRSRQNSPPHFRPLPALPNFHEISVTA